MTSRLLVAVAFLAIAGCHSAPPREDLYPAFYLNRERLPEELQRSLDHNREAVLATPQDSEVLLSYARSVARLASKEVDMWFAAAHDVESVNPSTQLLQGESRMIQSCRHALALYHEAQLNGAVPAWTDQITVAWFSILTGNEARAELILADLAVDPRVPDRALEPLRELLQCLPHLPGV